MMMTRVLFRAAIAPLAIAALAACDARNGVIIDNWGWASARIYGAVTLPSGNAAVGARVRTIFSSAAVATTDSAGRYALEVAAMGMGPGRLAITVVVYPPAGAAGLADSTTAVDTVTWFTTPPITDSTHIDIALQPKS